MPYTGPLLTVNEVDRYLVSTDGNAVCFQDDLDSTCIKLGQETANGADTTNGPAIHIYPERRLYLFYHEGNPIFRAERVGDNNGNNGGNNGNGNGDNNNNNGNNNNNNNGNNNGNNGGNNGNNGGNNGNNNNGNNNNNNNGNNGGNNSNNGNNGNNNNNNGSPPNDGNSGDNDGNPGNNGTGPTTDPPAGGPSTPNGQDTNNNNAPTDPTVGPPQGGPSTPNGQDTNNDNSDDGHGWIIWVYYPEETVPQSSPTLSESGVTVTINGKQLTDADITGFAQFIGPNGETGIQFFYPTQSAELLDLKIRMEGVVAEDDPVKFNINYLWNSQ